MLKTASETAEEDADSLFEPDWKKIVVDSNAVLLMSGNHDNDNDNDNDNAVSYTHLTLPTIYSV